MASRSARREDRPDRPGMADVAELAGVSAQTVSRVLRSQSSVRPETRQRVLDAVEQLGYRPNYVARALSTGRTRTIGVIAADSISYGEAAVAHGIEAAARRAGFFVTSTSVAPASRANLVEAMARLVDHGVEGIIVAATPPDDGPATEAYVTTVPVVTIGHTVADAIPVSVDQHRAGRLATEHLLDLGHATVWHVGGPPHSDAAKDAAAGWRAALEDAHREVPPVLSGDGSPSSGYRLGVELAADLSVTAVFAASDEMAFGLVRAFTEGARSVPASVAIVGLDDIPLAASSLPPLTTVRQPFVELGEAAVRVLLLGDGAPVVLSPELIVRATTSTAVRGS